MALPRRTGIRFSFRSPFPVRLSKPTDSALMPGSNRSSSHPRTAPCRPAVTSAPAGAALRSTCRPICMRTGSGRSWWTHSRGESLAAAVEPLVTIPPHSRRRAVMSAYRDGAQVVLGFNRRSSDDIIDMIECPVVTPSIEAALPALRAVLATILRGKDRAQITVLAFADRSRPRLRAARAARRGYAGGVRACRFAVRHRAGQHRRRRGVRAHITDASVRRGGGHS